METREATSLQRRAAIRPASLDRETRSVEVVWTTGAKVRRSSWFDGDFYEELDVAPGAVRMDRLNKGANLLNNHRAESLADVIGIVERAWLDGSEGHAVVRFSERDEVEPIWRDVASGILRHISVGYRIHNWVEEKAAKRGDPPTIRVTDWEPHELSLVPVPADAGASVRSNDHNMIPSHPMTDPNRQAGGDPASVTPTVPDAADRSAAMPSPSAAAAAPMNPSSSSPETEQRGDDLAALRRENSIRKIAGLCDLSGEFIEQLVVSSRSVEDCQVEMAREMRRRLLAQHQGPALDSPMNTPATGVQVTDDAGDKVVRQLEGALAYRVGLDSTPSDEARGLVGASLMEMVGVYLQSRGVNPFGMSTSERVTRAFHSSSDFPLLFSNLASKQLDAGYAEEPQTWRPFARQRNLSDFKPVYDLEVAGQLIPEPLLEGGEYKAGTLKEAQHTWRIQTYAKKIGLTRQAIINDDLSAMERIPEMLGRGFRLLESNMIYDLLTTGGTGATVSSDGLALFNAGHNNTTAGAISIAAIDAAYQAMMDQTDIAGNRLNLEPSFLLVPPALRTAALQFLYPAGYQPTTLTGETAANVFAGALQPIVESRLTDVSTTQFYLIANPSRIDTIQFGYLAGEPGPTITSSEKRDPDGMEMLARFDFGCCVKNFRGFVRSSGS